MTTWAKTGVWVQTLIVSIEGNEWREMRFVHCEWSKLNLCLEVHHGGCRQTESHQSFGQTFGEWKLKRRCCWAGALEAVDRDLRLGGSRRECEGGGLDDK